MSSTFMLPDKFRNAFSKINISTLINLFFILFCIILIFPYHIFYTPGEGLDASWAISLGISIEKNFMFGRDFIFTYGPLGYLATRLPIGVSKFAIVFFDLYLLFNIGFVLHYILSRNKGLSVYLLLFLILNLLGNFHNHDIAIILIWLLIFMFSYYINHLKTASLFNGILLTTLLFFIKINTGIVALFLFIFFLMYCCLISILSYRQAFKYILVQISILILFSIYFKVATIDYFVSSLHLIDAYNDAMYASLDPAKIYLLYSALTILAFYIYTGFKNYYVLKNNLKEAFTYLIVLPLLYIIFKQAFVRADIDHVISFFAFVSIFISLPIINNGIMSKSLLKLLLLTIFICYLCVSNINSLYNLEHIKNKFIHTKVYLENVLDSNYKVDRTSSSDKLRIPPRLLQIIGNSSVDIAPYEIAYIYYNNLNYKPRPVIQSYSAYDAYLDNKNYEKYTSESAPDFILYHIESVDNRYALFDEAKTKIAILSNYEIVDRSWYYLLLKKLQKPIHKKVFLTHQGTSQLEEYISIKPSKELQYMKFNIEYSILGKIRRFLFQPPELLITLQLEDKTEHTFKAVNPIINAGVIINKYIPNYNNLADTDLFISFNGEKNKNVTKVKFHTPDSWGFIPTFDYSVEFIKIDNKEKNFDDNNPIANINLIQPTNNILGNIDILAQANEYIDLQGWASIAGMGAEQSKAYIILQSTVDTLVYSTIMTNRHDVTEYLKTFNYDNAGYRSVILKENIPPGDYSVGIFIVKNDTIKGLQFDNTKKLQINYGKPVSVEQKLSVEVPNILLPKLTSSLHLNVEHLTDEHDFIEIKGWCHIDSLDSKGDKVYVVLKSPKKTYVFNSLSEHRPDVTAYFSASHLDLDDSGFAAYIDKQKLKGGNYQIGLFIVKSDDRKSFQLINKQTSIRE